MTTSSPWTRRALLGLIVISGALRLLWASAVGPGNDEAYHYLFTVHPSWSYFDHPPMLAWVAAAGIRLAGGTATAFTLRLGFIALFAGSTWLMARLGSRLYGDRAGWFAAIALNVTAYYTAAAGTFALPDGPLLFFWLLTLERLSVALEVVEDTSRGWRVSLLAWAGVGVAWGGALLSKYHGVFLPLGVLVYLVVEPSARRWLRHPGPYLASVIGLTLFSPVLIWNARNHWASFAFQGARAVGSGGFRPEFLAWAVLGPALYLFPWIWARLVALLIGRGRRLFEPETTRSDRFLWSQSVAPLATFLAVACTRAVLPHWTLVGFLPLYPMLGRAWERSADADPRAFRRRAAWLAGVPLTLTLLVAWQIQTGVLQDGLRSVGWNLPEGDPTSDLYGWDQVAAELKRRGLVDGQGKGPFLFTADWYLSGQIAFALRDTPVPVLCYHAWDARSFAFWSRPDEWVGRDGLLIAVNDRSTEPGRFDRWFTRIEPIGSFDVVRGGQPIRKIRLFRCERQTLAFPFDDLGRSVRPKAKDPSHPGGRLATSATDNDRPR